jgi:hypothetical protein
MATQALRRLICRFRKHQWRFEHNRETQGLEADCLRCGAHKSAYPGPLEPNLAGLRPSPTRRDFSPWFLGSGRAG